MNPQAASVAPMSEPARLAGVYFEPGAAFADIAARPRWWIPMVLIALAGLVMMSIFSQRVGWDHTVRRQIEANERMQNLPPEQREQAIERGVKIAPVFGYLGALVFAPVGMLVIALALMLVFNSVYAAEIPFKRALAITTYASLPGLIYIALAILVMFIKSPEDYDIQNPLAFNVGAFLSSESPRWLKALCSSFDLFTLWSIALLATGFSAAAARKIKWSKALIGVIVPWLVWVGVKTGSAALF
jgi:hypothetical protein